MTVANMTLAREILVIWLVDKHSMGQNEALFAGGPLVCDDGSGRWTLYGVVSHGAGCGLANFPGIYTDVVKMLDWIKSHKHF